ncbi:MAG TPA: response regulator [Roseiflexaceae bacterium]|nr:response regulator [Roseiflexaceae bacterium]HMP39670.1 response regulator [Roseiflexaceae bacterium]
MMAFVPAIRTILLVEDDPDIQAVAQLALEAVGGYSVVVCSSGNEALSVVAELQPSVILLDVMMPGIDGPTTLQSLQESGTLGDTPVIFMTARVQPQEIIEYRRLGAIDVIVKPFDPMSLAATVAQIWERYHNERQ